ncbi:hypothetical protein A4X06_0g4930 [Tilletia controversa]|uniref:tripeptidyl-peptidase II n=1 Tax=Tilletia controversa TaxID=13291 RepID=A0A8X7MRK0_9BASI|nr:hypothetical protein CF328_g4583 [Tilletia controversa]KAE8246653.1 hypothetical protein A4X06_0g4930 [Tilletia controversa]
MPSTAPTNPFPISGLLPKESTNALAFKQKYGYDGTGVRVAILDTGIDPAALGLAAKGKVVDVIDCTGSGDIPLTNIVPESTTATAAAPATIAFKSPVTGRTLLASKDWKNPSGKWKTGTKPAFHVWPQDLIRRMTAARKNAFTIEISRLQANLQHDLLAISSGPAAPTDDKSADLPAAEKKSDADATKEKDQAANARAQKVQEIKARISVLGELAALPDPGPILELLTWHDGTHWRTVVGGADELRTVPSSKNDPAAPSSVYDPSKGFEGTPRALRLADEVIDLSGKKPMADFRVERHWEESDPVSLMTYSVNHLTSRTGLEPEPASQEEQEDIKALSLVIAAGSHASHVAGIVAARRDYVEGGEKEEDVRSYDGVASGAQLVSLKIGDTRLGSMETQQALLRAAQAILATKCDVANLSYGEASAFGVDNRGAFVELLRDIVIRQRDVVFVSSAGNAGPALTSAGAPGGTTSSILSVGAWVDAGNMQRAEYALIEDVPSSATTWSSRGPTSDGHIGVSVYAPGAAITSIPRYCLQATMLANGTSMSSPSAAGCVALIISGMKKEGIPVTATRVIKAIIATAKDVGDPLGVPFIQTDKAFEYIREHKDRPDQDAEFHVSVTPAGKVPGNAGTDKRGIYLREKHETHRLNQYTVTIRPSFNKPHETERALNLQIKCAISSSSSAGGADWIQVPQFVHLGGNGRSFEIRVDPTSLEAGLHHARIEVWDADTPGFKLVDVPVTVAKPIVLRSSVSNSTGPTSASSSSIRFDNVALSSGKVDRRYVSVPEGATWAEIRFATKNHGVSDAKARLWLTCVQLEPQRRLGECEHSAVLSLGEGESRVQKFRVRGGLTMEVVLAQFWGQRTAFELDFVMEFHGIQTSQVASGREETTIVGGEGIARIDCVSNVRAEKFVPSLSFEWRRTFVRPEGCVVRPLTTERDLMPGGAHLVEAVLTYPLVLKEAGATVKLLTPVSWNLYDNAVPLLIQVFEKHSKKRVWFGDVYPKEITDLGKGDYVIKIQLLAPNMTVLNGLKNMTLTVDQKLSKGKEIKLDLYEHHVDMFSEKKPASFNGNIQLLPGETKTLVLNTDLQGDKVPKEAQPGDLLLGQFGFDKGQSTLRYIVPPSIKKEKDETGGAVAAEKEGVAELMTGLVGQIKDEKEKKAFLDRLVSEHPDNLGVLVARLAALDAVADKPGNAGEVDAAADAILAQVDEGALKLWMANKGAPPSELDGEAKAELKLNEKRKEAVLAALNAKARAVLARQDQGQGEGQEQVQPLPAEAEELYFRLRAYLGPAASATGQPKYRQLALRHLIGRGLYGQALVLVRTVSKELGVGSGAEEGVELERLKGWEGDLVGVGRLGWGAVAAVGERRRVVDSAKGYADF